ncbi:hypothetical protein G6L74_05980 [Agrobacterium tumefaciens]|uniref:hypothetical protein n=1 Tax=Agrobacterium tumefaciens TaxID=358 RepID=UPI001574B923|nr:hypothetical protein [Agrobacterium tumefaciens]
MVTDEMIRVALLAFQSGDMDWSSQDEELMRFALEEALSAMPKPKPVAHLVWLQGRRAADDVEDYYEVARPGDKSVDGSDPFPVYATPPALEAALSAAEPEGFVKLTMPGETWHSWKTCAASDPGARPFYFSPVLRGIEWKKLDDAYSNFINAYGDPFKPKRNHEKETERNVKALSEAFDAARSALSGSQQSAQAVVVKALEWRQFTDRENDIEAITPCGRYAIRPSITAKRFRLYVPDGKEVGLYETLQETKAAAQTDYEARIRSALSAQVQDVADMPQSPWPASDWAIGRIKELEAQAIPEGWQLVPKEPTHAMISAMAESKAKDDEGEFLCLSELLDFSGENKTHTVLKAAYRAALPAAPAKQEGCE